MDRLFPSALALTFVFIILPITNFGEISATSCAPPAADYAMSKADVVFSGKVIDIEYLDDPEEVTEPRVIVTIDVYKSWKGSEDNKIILNTVQNAWSKEGYFFFEDKEYLVYANIKDDGTLGVYLCGGTKYLENAQEDIAKLDEGISIPVDNNPDATSSVPLVKCTVGENIVLVITTTIAAILLVVGLLFFAKKHKK